MANVSLRHIYKIYDGGVTAVTDFTDEWVSIIKPTELSSPYTHDNALFVSRDVFPSASPQNTSCSAPPARKVAAGRLPPARPFPLGG
jgi:hypothetical protein